MKKTKVKYYTQPEYVGGKKVKASDVPENWHSVYFEDEHANDSSEVEILTHENSSCLTRKQIDKQFNAFRTKRDALKAAAQIRKVLRGKFL